MWDSDTDNKMIDEQFTDHSWKKMKQLLDKEMPIHRNRKRGVIWFFLLGAIGLGIWYFSQNYTPEKPVENAEPIAMENFDASTENTQIIDNESVEKKNLPEEKNNFSNETAINSISNNKNTATKTNNSIILENRKNIVTNSAGDDQELNASPGAGQVREIDEVDNIIFTKENKTAFAEQNFGFEEKNQDVKPLLGFLKIPTIHSLIDFPNDLPELNLAAVSKFDEENLTDILPKRKTTLGAYIGGVVGNTNSKQPGYLAGVQVHIPLGKKWGITSGLGYSLIQEDQKIEINETHQALLDTPDSSIFPQYAEVISSNYISVENLQFLDLPLVATFEARKKWQLSAGLNFSYLIDAKISDQNNDIAFADINNSPAGIELDDLRTSDLSFTQISEELRFEKFHANAVLGVGWHPSRRWNIQLQYHHGMNNFVKSFSQNRTEMESTTVTQGSFNSYDNYRTSYLKTKQKIDPQSIRLTVGYLFFK